MSERKVIKLSWGHLLGGRSEEFPLLFRATRYTQLLANTTCKWFYDDDVPLWNYSQIVRYGYGISHARMAIRGEGSCLDDPAPLKVDQRSRMVEKFLRDMELALTEGVRERREIDVPGWYDEYEDIYYPASVEVVQSMGGVRSLMGRDAVDSDVLILKELRSPRITTNSGMPDCDGYQEDLLWEGSLAVVHRDYFVSGVGRAA